MPRSDELAHALGLIEANDAARVATDTSDSTSATTSADDDALPNDCTEDGLAQSFTERHAGTLRFCVTLGGWHVYDAPRWTRDTSLLAFDTARSLCRDIARSRELSARQYARLLSAATVAAVVKLASADRRHAVVADQFDADRMALNTPAGLVDLRTGQVSPNHPNHLCTHATAVAPEGDAPRWRQFLAEVTGGDADLQAYLQRLVGYWLTGETKEHALVFLYGTGGNGKSVFLNVLQFVLGDYAMTAPMGLFEERKHEQHSTELAMLRSARVAIATETDEGKRFAESRVKLMTGGDRITARFMRADFFTYQPQFKPVIAGNHRPKFRNADEAIRRRLHLIPFTQTFAEPDRELPEKLRAEAGGILAWAIAGCLAWQRIGLQPPSAVQAATADFIEDEDAVGAWLAECAEIDAEAWTSSADLFASWNAWATSRGEYVGQAPRLGAALQAKGFAHAKNSAGTKRGYRGIALTSPPSLGRDGRPAAISTSTRAHDAHTRTRRQRVYTETPSDASEDDCRTCEDLRERYGRPEMRCADCRDTTERVA